MINEASIRPEPESSETAPVPAPARRDANRPLSLQLHDMSARLGQDRMRLEQFVGVFQGRTTHLLVILLTLPFLLPIPLPFLSTPFGIIIALTGLRIATRRKPWVPARLASRELPAGFLAGILGAAGRIMGWLERLTRPRWVAPAHLRRFHRLGGTLIAGSASLLLLPLPVPLSNSLPASAILLFAIACLRRDGLCFLAGCVMLMLSLGFFGAICIGGIEITNWLWK